MNEYPIIKICKALNTIQTEIENQTINKIKPNQGSDKGKVDWVECEFNDVLEIISGKNQKQVVDSDGKYPIYGSGGIIGKANDFLCESGTTIIGRKGTINSPIYVRSKFWNVDTAFGLSPLRILNNRLLFFFTLLFNFKALDKSTAVPSLAKRDLLRITFPLPPLPIQRAIVKKIEELFSSLDSGIADLKKAQEQLKIYRQAVLKKAFEGEFKMVELREIIDRIEAGKSFRCDERPPNEGEVGIIKVSAITWGSFQENESKTVTDNSKINSRYFIKEGDFLLSRANTIELVGNSVIVNKIKKTLMLSDKSLRIVFNKNFNPFFALHFLSSVDGKNQIQLLSTGNQDSMRNIGQERIKQIKIPLPNFQEQQKIVREIESRLSVCDKVEESIKESLNKAEALRQSILKKAFEGKLLSDAEIEQCKAAKDYEPASVLLEKIKAEKKQK